jgi:anti-anti-sigma factor
MKILTKSSENYITLEIDGRIDSITSIDFQDALLEAFDENVNVTLDFRLVPYISSAGFRVLLMGQKTANGRHGDFKVINVAEHLKSIFDLTGFSDIISINYEGEG